MPQCQKCHGAGFTLHQVAWSMDRVRILCKTCDGIGYTYRKVMTPTQRKQLAQILLKEGEEGWRVERRHVQLCEWNKLVSDHTIDCCSYHYRAVRIERVTTRTPLPIEHYRRGMEVVLGGGGSMVVLDMENESALLLNEQGDMDNRVADVAAITLWRWPNETEWKPAYTETVKEKIVETLIVEGL